MAIKTTKRCVGLCLMLTFVPAACKSKRSNLESLSPSFTKTTDGTLPLKQEESHSLYELMRSKETAFGLQLTEGTLHSNEGLLQCGKEIVGAMPPCYLRVKLAKPNGFSQNLTLPSELAKTAWDFLRSAPLLAKEPLVIADLKCDYIGKATPPYGVETTNCTMSYPRLPNETIITGKIAEEVSNKLQGETPYSGTLAKPAGSALCYWSAKDQTPECLLRSIKEGVLQEQFIPATPETATTLYKALLNSALFTFEAATTAGEKKVFEAPDEYMSAVSCILDLERLKTPGQSYAHCKLTL